MHVVCGPAVVTGRFTQLRSHGFPRHILTPLVCLQHVSDFFVTSANAALSKSDDPEKVRSHVAQLHVEMTIHAASTWLCQENCATCNLDFGCKHKSAVAAV